MTGSSRRNLWLRIASVLAVASLPLLGCQSIANSSYSQTQVRVIDASYNAPALDVDVATTPIATNIGSGTFSNYAFLPPENATAYVYPTGTKKAGGQTEGQFLVNEQHSILISDSGKGYAASILTDQPAAAPAGSFSIRFLHQALQAGAVDIYLVPDGSTLADAKPLYANVAPRSVEGYANVPAGSYAIVVTPAGVTKTPSATTAIQFVAGQVRTVLIMDAQLTTNPPVTVTVGDDVN
jgi:hypothetical protein